MLGRLRRGEAVLMCPVDYVSMSHRRLPRLPLFLRETYEAVDQRLGDFPHPDPTALLSQVRQPIVVADDDLLNQTVEVNAVLGMELGARVHGR